MAKPLVKVEVFKNMTKAEKTKFLKEARLVNSDKFIRESWDMTYGAYDYYLKTLELKDTINENDTPSLFGPKHKEKKEEFIDLAFHVYEEPEQPTAPPPAAPVPDPVLALEAPKAPTHMISYPSVKGNVAQLRKRLEAILTLVELDGEDAELMLSITIDRVQKGEGA